MSTGWGPGPQHGDARGMEGMDRTTVTIPKKSEPKQANAER